MTEVATRGGALVIMPWSVQPEEPSMSAVSRPSRSVLFMPASNARALEKARSLGADGLIFDLEDAVAPDAKPAARESVARALAAGGYGARELFLRVNALSTPWVTGAKPRA